MRGSNPTSAFRIAEAVVLVAAVLVLGCGEDRTPDREAFSQLPVLRELGPAAEVSWGALGEAVRFDERDRWDVVEVARSVITGTRRRLHFEKEAVVMALENHERPRNGEGPPLRYPVGSVFVAESIDEDGAVVDRAVLRIDANGAPRYSVFDGAGAPLTALTLAAGDGAAPDSCTRCHEGRDAFHPMMSFPSEPRDVLLDIDPGDRDLSIALALVEGRRRGSPVFGVYATLMLSRLARAVRQGTVLDADRPRLERLRERHGDLLGGE